MYPLYTFNCNEDFASLVNSLFPEQRALFFLDDVRERVLFFLFLESVFWASFQWQALKYAWSTSRIGAGRRESYGKGVNRTGKV
jgi:hypothetical protein